MEYQLEGSGSQAARAIASSVNKLTTFTRSLEAISKKMAGQVKKHTITKGLALKAGDEELAEESEAYAAI